MKNPVNEKLKVLASIIAIFALGLLYILLSELPLGEATNTLILNIIPSAIVVLIVIPFIYYIFKVHHSDTKKIIEGLNADVVEHKHPVSLFDNYRKVKWKEILKNAKSIDMAVCYMDSWVNDNWEELIDFFRRGGSIKVFLPDPNTDLAMKVVCDRFPKFSSVEEARKRIDDTNSNFMRTFELSKPTTGMYSAYYLAEVLNYAAIRIDKELLFLSIYEHAGVHRRVGAPSIRIDLGDLSAQEEFWDAEFNALSKKGRLGDTV